MVPRPVVHGGSSENAAQHIQQYLSSVLSQRGLSSLPYSEDVKWLIRQHLLTLAESYPSLQPKTAAYAPNDGRSAAALLLVAYGTLPILFQGAAYNIPILIWLTDSYPRHAPLVYVNPTRDMVIKRPHPFVDPSSGLVSIPYLSSDWVYPSSNLLDLARHLSHYFGRDPPLLSQHGPPNSNPNPHPNLAISGGNSFSRPEIPPRTYPQSPYGSSNGRVVTDDPVEVFKRSAMNKLVESLHSDIGDLRKAREAEMEGVFSAQTVLRQREEQVGKGLGEMEEEKEALEGQLQVGLMNTDVLEGWLRENEGKVGNVRDLDADDVFEPCDVLSEQMLECSASDLGIEDVIYCLDKAVQEGLVPFAQYIRNVRLLSREQFFHRATNSKVRAAQMQAQVTSMAATVLQQAV